MPNLKYKTKTTLLVSMFTSEVTNNIYSILLLFQNVHQSASVIFDAHFNIYFFVLLYLCHSDDNASTLSNNVLDVIFLIIVNSTTAYM